MNNPDFNFIHYQGTDESNYYRWRVYSYCQGDKDEHWREEPFQFTTLGDAWFPPKSPLKYDDISTNSIFEIKTIFF